MMTIQTAFIASHMPDVLDGVSIALTAVAVMIAIWAIFLNRSKGHPRCPKCWYDMTGAVGRRCPECGRQVRDERQLYRTRRRWRLAFLASFPLLIAAYAAYASTNYQQRGWIGAVPTTALIVAEPWLEYEEGLMGQYPSPDSSVKERLYAELRFNRINSRLWWWQRRLLFEICWQRFPKQPHRLSSFSPRRHTTLFEMHYKGLLTPSEIRRLRDRSALTLVHTRDRWPVGVPLRIRIDPYGWFRTTDVFGHLRESLHADETKTAIVALDPVNQHWCNSSVSRWPPSNGAFDLAPPVAGASRVEIDLVLREVSQQAANDKDPSGEPPLWSRRVTLPIKIVGSAREALTPVQSSELDRALQSNLVAALTPAGAPSRGYLLTFDVSSITGTLKEFDVALAFSVDLLHDGAVCATSDALWSPLNIGSVDEVANFVNPSRDMSQWIVLQFDPKLSPVPTAMEGQWSLRLRANPSLILPDLSLERYWDGEFMLPLAPDDDGATLRTIPTVLRAKRDAERQHSRGSTSEQL